MEHLVKEVTRDILSKHPEEYEYFKKQASNDHESVLQNLTDKDFIRYLTLYHNIPVFNNIKAEVFWKLFGKKENIIVIKIVSLSHSVSALPKNS